MLPYDGKKGGGRMRSVDQQVQPKERDIVKEIGTQASAGNQDTKYCEEIHCSGVFSMV